MTLPAFYFESFLEAAVLGLTPFVLAALSTAVILVTGALVYFALRCRSLKRRITALTDTLDEQKLRITHISHELRSPLSAVHMHLDLLSTHPAMPTQFLADLQNASYASEQLLSLVNDFLDSAQARSGKLRPEPTLTQPARLIQSCTNALHVLARDQDLSLESHINKSVPEWVLIDQRRLKQVLTNLLANALQFTHAGHVLVQLDWSSASDQGEADRAGTLILQVIDTGPGIPSAELAQVFSPFYTTRNKAHNKAHSTGLGLSIVKDICEACGWVLCVQSQCAPAVSGTTFEVRIQTNSVHAPQALFSTNSPEEPQPTSDNKGIENAVDMKLGNVADNKTETDTATPYTPTVGAPLRILIIDDIATNRLVLELALRRIDEDLRQGRMTCEPKTCEDLSPALICSQAPGAQEALDLLTHTSFDLILLDWNLPGIGGGAFLEALNAASSPISSRPTVVVITGEPSSPVSEACQALGVQAVWQKPVERKQLATLIETLNTTLRNAPYV